MWHCSLSTYFIPQWFHIIAYVWQSRIEIEHYSIAHTLSSSQSLMRYCAELLASSPGPTQILSRSRGEKSGEGLGSKLRHNRKWWTRLVRNVDSVS